LRDLILDLGDLGGNIRLLGRRQDTNFDAELLTFFESALLHRGPERIAGARSLHVHQYGLGIGRRGRERQGASRCSDQERFQHHKSSH
jgi:hypothetical protein